MPNPLLVQGGSSGGSSNPLLVSGGNGGNSSNPLLVSGGQPAAAPSHGGGGIGGFLHSVVHNPVTNEIGKTASGLVSDVVHAPGGLVKVAEVTAPLAEALVGGPLPSGKQLAAAGSLAKGMGEQTVKSLTDPSYMAAHPDQFLLSALGVASGGVGLAARAAEATKALAAADAAGGAGRLAAAGKALVTKPPPVTRLISHDGYSVKLPAAPNLLTRTVQKSADRLRMAFPDVPVLGAPSKIGQVERRLRNYEARAASVPIQTMTAKAREAGMLTKVGHVPGAPYTKDALARQHALRVVAEGVPTDTRIAKHEDMIENHKPSQATAPEIRAMRDKTFVSGHQEQIDLNNAAKKYLDESGGTPKLTDPKMQAAYDAMLKVAGGREELVKRLGALEEETMRGRLSKPGQFFTGNEKFAGGEMRIPTTPAYKGRKSTGLQFGSPGGIGELKAPGSLTHAYEGLAYKGGKIRTDVVKLMAESALEAQKYWTLLHVGDRLKAAAKDFPTSEKYDVPIVTDNIPGRPSLQEARARIEEEQATPATLATMSHGNEAVRQAVFPEKEAAAGVPGVKWIDKRLLGGLNEPNPLFSFKNNAVGGKIVSGFDAINNASKLAILYLKPAYVAPNLLSNVAMNLVQQGFAAPVNLARGAKLWAKADPETVQAVLAQMGEGRYSVLDANAGVAAKVAHGAASFWQKPVDVLPRLASFLYEARRDGVTTEAQLKALLKDPAQADKLQQVTLRANDAMIDFGDLTPFERSIISRVVFFYPWVKGSAKWLGRFPVEHPVQAGALGVLGAAGKQAQEQALGSQIPGWGQALVPTGQTGPHGLPETFDPFTVTPFVQSGNLLQSLGSIAAGHPSRAASSIGGMLTPAASTIGTLAHKGPVAAAEGLVKNLPLVLQAQQAMGKGSKTYPYEGTAMQALLRYLIGTGMIPRETSPQELEKSAYLERHGKTITVPR